MIRQSSVFLPLLADHHPVGKIHDLLLWNLRPSSSYSGATERRVFGAPSKASLFHRQLKITISGVVILQ